MKQWVGRVGTALAVATLSFAAGCAGFFVYPGSTGTGTGGGTGSTTGDYVYVANTTTASLAGFAVGTGTLTAVNSPYKLGFTPISVVVNPADTLLYVAGFNNASTPLIYAFSIGTGGALSALNSGNAVGMGNEEVSMAISPDGQWLIGLNGNNSELDEYQINSSTGVLTAPAVVPYSVSNTGAVTPRQIKFSPNGQLVFVALGTAGDLVFTFNTAITSGALVSSQAVTFSTNTSDNALAISPSGNYVYMARSGVNGGVIAYSIGTNGALTQVSTQPVTGTQPQPYSVVVNLAGTDVYVADRADSTISGYSVSSTGTLTALSGSPYKSGNAVTALAVDKSGSYLLAASNGGSADLTMYSFDSSGNLVPATTTSTDTDPAGPTAIAVTH